MKTVAPNTKFVDAEHSTAGELFDPMSINGEDLRCICGYRLIVEDDKLYRCEGGNHQYHINEGDVELDKFGNIMLRTPAGL